MRKTDDKVNLFFQMWNNKYGDIGLTIYDKHNANVRRILPKDQLLVYDVREGWEPLCPFLEVPVPAELSPNLNSSAAMKAMYTGMMLFGTCTWLLYAGGVSIAVHLALHPQDVTSLVRRAMTWSQHAAAKTSLR